MSFLSKVELKYQLRQMGIKIEGNCVKKSEIDKVLADTKLTQPLYIHMDIKNGAEVSQYDADLISIGEKHASLKVDNAGKITVGDQCNLKILLVGLATTGKASGSVSAVRGADIQVDLKVIEPKLLNWIKKLPQIIKDRII